MARFTALEPALLSYQQAHSSGFTSSETGVSGLHPVRGCRGPGDPVTASSAGRAVTRGGHAPRASESAEAPPRVRTPGEPWPA